MIATEELRRMLDERGVKWREWRYGGESFTTIWPALDTEAHYRENRHGGLRLYADGVTPQQAVEATLGRGTCHIMTCDNLNELGGDVWLECDACHWQMDYADAPSMPLNFCPNCGRMVTDKREDER